MHFNIDHIRKEDPEVARALDLEIERQQTHLELIASENFTSRAILEAAGTSLDNAVSATFILKEAEDFPGFNEEWNKWFPKDPPARQAAKMPLQVKTMKISIALIAEA